MDMNIKYRNFEKNNTCLSVTRLSATLDLQTDFFQSSVVQHGAVT